MKLKSFDDRLRSRYIHTAVLQGGGLQGGHTCEGVVRRGQRSVPTALLPQEESGALDHDEAGLGEAVEHMQVGFTVKSVRLNWALALPGTETT